MSPMITALVRELRRSPLLGAVGAVTFPVWYQLSRSHDDVETSALLAVVAGGSLIAFAFDDPAESALNSCTLGRTARRRARMLLVAALLAGCWAVVVVVVEANGAELGRVSDRIPEVIAAAAVASAIAAVGLRHGMTKPGFGAALAAVCALAVSTGMSAWSSRLRWLPQIANPAHANRWWATAGLAAVVAGWCARDPATRPLAAGLVRHRRTRSSSRRSDGPRNRADHTNM